MADLLVNRVVCDVLDFCDSLAGRNPLAGPETEKWIRMHNPQTPTDWGLSVNLKEFLREQKGETND